MNIYKAVSLLVICSLFLFSCDMLRSSDDDEAGVSFEDGISEHVWEFMTPELLESIEEDLEMPIHRGDDPPVFDPEFNSYLMNPLVLVATTVPNDNASPGQVYSATFIRFYNQNTSEFTIELDKIEGSVASAAGKGGYIVGNGGQFTVFSQLEYKLSHASETADALFIYSGVLQEEGIADLHMSIIMLDNKGDDSYIENDSGRSFHDGDGFSEVIEWPEGDLVKERVIEEFGTGSVLRK